MSSDRSSIGFTLLGLGMLIGLYSAPEVHDTKKAQNLASRLQSIQPTKDFDEISWARFTLDGIGLTDIPVGMKVNLKYSTNTRGTGIDIHNSGKYLGTVDLDRVESYLDSLDKR